jgi:hypothetical protein
MNVRFEGNIGHDADVTRYLLMTLNGHWLAEGPAEKPGHLSTEEILSLAEPSSQLARIQERTAAIFSDSAAGSG